jgi:hypothetical protein
MDKSKGDFILECSDKLVCWVELYQITTYVLQSHYYHEEFAKSFNAQERAEIADYMIDKWTTFKEEQ